MPGRGRSNRSLQTSQTSQGSCSRPVQQVRVSASARVAHAIRTLIDFLSCQAVAGDTNSHASPTATLAIIKIEGELNLLGQHCQTDSMCSSLTSSGGLPMLAVFAD